MQRSPGTRARGRLKRRVMLPLAVCLLVVSASAQAATWQPAGRETGRFRCADESQQYTDLGTVDYKACLVVYRTSGGTYFQGLLAARIDTTCECRSYAFSGSTASRVDGVNAEKDKCGSITFLPAERKWCLTSTRFVRHGHRLAGLGILTFLGMGTWLQSPGVYYS